MAGRPAIFTAELGAAVERRLTGGESLKAIERDTALSVRTIGGWLQEGLIRRVPARDVGVSALLADHEPALVGMVVRAGQRDWRAAAWLLERRWPGSEIVRLGGGNDGVGINRIDGDDAYFGDGGRDQVTGTLAPGPMVIDLTAGQLEGDRTGSDTAVSFEAAFGTRGDDTLIGNAANNLLLGLFGDDHIEGRDGSDSLDGREGVDFLDGGNGSDECLRGETLLNCEG